MEDSTLVNVFEGETKLSEPLHDCLLSKVFSFQFPLFHVENGNLEFNY